LVVAGASVDRITFLGWGFPRERSCGDSSAAAHWRLATWSPVHAMFRRPLSEPGIPNALAADTLHASALSAAERFSNSSGTWISPSGIQHRLAWA